ncbi:MAG: peptidylprolyl isomerase [Pseudomonadota bacterium]|nr:peptidylprolyl isomerase [Pseudomonadota bacterium]MDE3038473.1 peptidylprolyl isomerase [Pseudomonadota bacterium]
MNKMAFVFLAAVLLSASASAKPAKSAAVHSGMDIAAIVGDEAITSYDVDNRVRFIIATANLSDTPEVAAHIRPQVILSLIDEKLELREAAKNNIKISDDEVKKAIISIEKERNMEPDAIEHIMEEHHVPKSTFTQQIRAQLAWNRLLMKKIRPQMHVSDEEIALAAKRPQVVTAGSHPQELRIAVIALPVDKPSRDAEVRKLADRLVREVRGGASFEEVSRQFSSSTASAVGRAESFWVMPGQLDPAVARALVAAKIGAVTDPVRTSEGYIIVKVYDARATSNNDAKDMEVNIKAILLKLKPGAPAHDADVLLQIGEDVARHPGSCTDKTVSGIENIDDVDITVDFRRSLMSELPPALKAVVDGLKVGEISTPLASDDGIRLYMLCDKQEAGVMPPDHERLYQMLMQHKMELEAQKYMRNLRRETYIEVR